METMATIKLRNTYKTEFMVKGTRYYKNHPTEAEGIAWEANVKARLKAGLPLDDIAPAKFAEVTFRQVADKCESTVFAHQAQGKDIHYTVNALVAFFGETRPISHITHHEIEKYKQSQLDLGTVSTNAINRKLSCLSRILTCAIDNNWLESKPVIRKFPQKENSRLLFWTDEQEEEIQEALYSINLPEFHWFFNWQIDTGMRPSEARRIHRRQVRKDPVMGWVVDLIKTKNGMRRTVPLTKKAYKAFQELSKGHEHPFVRFTPQAIRYAWSKLRLAVGCTNPNFVFYITRHTCASRLMQRINNPKVVQQWMGHKNIEETMKYAKLSPTNLLEAKQALQ
jgi:integrase